MLSDDQKKSTTHTKVPEVEAYAPPSDEEVDGLSSEDDTHVDEAEQPKNRLKGPLCVAGCFMGLFGTFGQVKAFGAFQAWYTENTLSHKSPSVVSWIGASQFAVLFILGWPLGVLFDRFGPRELLFVGGVLSVLSLMLASISKTYVAILMTHGILFGLGTGCMFVPCISSAVTYYPKYKSTVVGIAIFGASLGGIVVPFIVHRLLATVGFERTLQVLGLVCLVTSVFSIATVSSRNSHNRSMSRPWFRIKGVFDTNFILLTSGHAIASLVLFTPYIFIVQYTATPRLASLTPFILPVMNAGAAVGRLVPSIISDFYGRFNLLILCKVLAAMSCITLFLPTTIGVHPTGASSHEIAMVVSFAILYGLFTGASTSLLSSCVFQISGRGQEATRLGVFNTLCAIPSLLAGPIGGAFLANGNKNGFMLMTVFTGSTLILGSLVILIARMRLSEGYFLVKV